MILLLISAGYILFAVFCAGLAFTTFGALGGILGFLAGLVLADVIFLEALKGLGVSANFIKDLFKRK